MPNPPLISEVARESTRSCTICKRDASASFRAQRYRLFSCEHCDYAFLDPAITAALSVETIFDDAYFCGGGAGYTNYLAEERLLRAHGTRYGRLLRAAGARHVLDVGAAAGFILRGLIDAGCSGVGIEPNASMSAYAARELALDVRRTTLEAFGSGEQFDAVTLLQVVDHLEDIRLSLARVRELTTPDGLCLIEFGDRASLTARVLASAWHEYAPPSVRRVFSLRALRRLLAEYGFTLHSFGHPPKYLRADHALSLLSYKAGSSAVRAIPAGAKLRYFGDDITWALFQKRL
jgi:SAM-dependent methyltransferase